MGQSLAPKPSPSNTGGINTLSTFFGGLQSNIYFRPPRSFNNWVQQDSGGMFWFDSANTKTMWYHNGTSRVQLGSGGGGSGTVTNVSTGFGMLGGPITTTGTVRVDSNVVLTVAMGYKVADSVAGLASTSLADSMGVARDSVVKRVPYRYANDTVLLGEYPIRAGQFRFDLTPTMPTVVGGMYWDTGNVTVSLPLNSDVNLQIGQESLVRARNNTGSTVTNGQVVYIAGAQGNNPTIGLADADSAATSQVIGVATEDIADNGTGFVTVSGVVNNVNTSAWNAGDKLYLSTTNGQLTNTPPTSPHISVTVGTALNSTNNGRIFVSPSQPVATDTNLLNGTTIPPTQYAVKSYVQSQGYATTAALADSVSGRVKYSDTVSLIGTQYQIDTTAFNALTRINTKGSGTVTSIQVVGGTGATVTPTTAVTTSGVYTVTPEVSSATFNTLSNKRWVPRVISAASYTTSVTIPADSVDLFQITAQAGALLFNAPSGTPNNGDLLVIRIKDNGTARALTYNAIFNWSPPSTTVLGKYLVMCFMYNSVTSNWNFMWKRDEP